MINFKVFARPSTFFASLALLATSGASAVDALNFQQACTPGKQYVVAAMGDLIPHSALVSDVMSRGKGFGGVWSTLEAHIKNADIAYVNVEGPIAPKMPTTGKQFSFNFPERVATDLIAAGFDVVSTANNHSMDRGSQGADQTVQLLQKIKLPFTGTRAKGSSAAWYTTTRSGDLTLGWVACTYGTNGIPDPHRQVLECGRDMAQIQNIIKNLIHLKIADAVMVTPHWGTEKAKSPDATQKKQARAFLEAGALAVIGSHPHVLQPWEKVNIGGEEKFIIYSLGNFASNQLYYGDALRTSMVLFLGLTQDRNGKIVINGVRHLPIYMKRDPYEIRPLESYRGVEGAWNGIRRMFSHEQEVRAKETKVVTNPECR